MVEEGKQLTLISRGRREVILGAWRIAVWGLHGDEGPRSGAGREGSNERKGLEVML